MKKIMPIISIGILILSGIGTNALLMDNSLQFNNNLKNNNYFLNNPSEEWNKTYGGDEIDNFQFVLQTIDGGYVAVGSKNANEFAWHDADCYLVKTDDYGEIQWERSFGGSQSEFGNFLIQTSDGGYIICGTTDSFGSGSYDGWIFKTNDIGQEQWSKTFGGAGQDWLLGIQQTSDDGYILIGYTESYGSGDREGWIVKIDDLGNEQWSKIYGNEENNEFFWSGEITSDNGYILTGGTRDLSNINSNAWVIKTDSDGNLQWEKSFGPAQMGRDIRQTSDGGYILLATATETDIGYFNPWLIKIDESGNEQWNKLIIPPKILIGEDPYSMLFSIYRTNDGGYVLTGNIGLLQPVHTVGNPWILKIDDEFNIVWQKIIEIPGYNPTYWIQETIDNGYIIAGTANSFKTNVNDWDAWLIKIAGFENQRPNKPSRPSGRTNGKTGVEYIYTTSTTDPDGGQIYYLWDWDDGSDSGWVGPVNSGEESSSFHVWNEKGNYEVRVKAKDINSAESEWSDPLVVSMPKNKMFYRFQFLCRFLEQYPRLLPILRLILEL